MYLQPKTSYLYELEIDFFQNVWLSDWAKEMP